MHPLSLQMRKLKTRQTKLLAQDCTIASKQNALMSIILSWSVGYSEALQLEAFISDPRKPLTSRYFRIQVLSSLLLHVRYVSMAWTTFIRVIKQQNVAERVVGHDLGTLLPARALHFTV